MAHSCPTCDSACYCGGDIDDILFDDDSEGAMGCTHCVDEPEGLDDEYLEDWCELPPSPAGSATND